MEGMMTWTTKCLKLMRLTMLRLKWRFLVTMSVHFSFLEYNPIQSLIHWLKNWNQISFLQFDFNEKIGISIRMNEDLRSAILKKAEEHQARIAQVLDLPVTEVSANYFSGQQERIETVKESKRSDSKSEENVQPTSEEKVVQRSDEKKIEENQNEEGKMMNPRLLAKLVVERSGIKNENWKEDTFGSSCSESSCSEVEEEDESNGKREGKKIHEWIKVLPPGLWGGKRCIFFCLCYINNEMELKSKPLFLSFYFSLLFFLSSLFSLSIFPKPLFYRHQLRQREREE